METLKRRIEKLQDLLIDEVITVAEYNNKKEIFTTQLSDLQDSLLTDSSKHLSQRSKIEKGISNIKC
jgi:hypothetical protein